MSNKMESRLSIVTLGVIELATAVSFYKDGLGLHIREDISNSYVAFFQLNGFLLGLYPSELLAEDAGVTHEKAAFSGITLAQNVQSQIEVDNLLSLARKAGANVTKEGEYKEWGGYSGYFQDPDGYLWEIAWSPDLVVETSPQ